MTFSIAARCPRTGQLGVGTSSKALASGAMVPYCRAAVGAIASQSFVNPYLGIDGIELLSQGLVAERALERVIDSDRGRDIRQVGVVDKDGRTAAYTGSKCIAWAGSVDGPGYVCLGNILAGEQVVKAMAEAFEAGHGDDLAERLLLALEAGQNAGGDRRGRQSAGIYVVAEEEYPLVNLRVDDHHDPIPELRRVFGVYQAEEVPDLDFMPKREDFTPHWEAVLRMKDACEDTIPEPAAKES
jgi:uncharacterized Ntn-hydrolase superfamily protein